jgi:beta-barrel assembly-enhancing protease
MVMPRTLSLPGALFSGLVALAVAMPTLAQDSLPEIGSSAAELISPADERRYARQMVAEMRRLGWLLEDPLLDDYIQGIGHRLAANSPQSRQEFAFFLLRDRQINAFATLAGHIGTNAGLMLTAEREDELAAVLAHEIAHVTQRHILRSVESAKKDALPITLAMIGAIIAAQQSGAGGDAAQAAIAGGMGLMAQRQINHTRANEHEADRIGIHILSRSGYDPLAMAEFFARMQRATRSGASDLPDLLRSHPVTTTRISEAKDRATGIAALPGRPLAQSQMPLNPALPGSVHASLGQISIETGREFPWARERMRVLSARSAAEAHAEYRRRIVAGDQLNDAEQYGLALTHIQLGAGDEAIALLAPLQARNPTQFWIDLAWAEAEHRAGRRDAADERFAALNQALPRNRAVAMAYADALAERGTREAGLRAQAVLRPLLDGGSNDPALHRAFALASERAGDTVRAGEAHAEAAFLSGRAEDALNQLSRLKQRPDLDYMQRARIDARMAAMTPLVLELRADGIRPDGSQRQRQLHEMRMPALR